MKVGIKKGTNLKMALAEMKGIIVDSLSSNITDSSKLDYLELAQEGKFSFLPKGKIDDKPWDSRLRQEAKMGVVLNKIMSHVTPYEIKTFVDEVKAIQSNTDFECKILSGDDLVWSYTKANIHWFEKFPMSCMSYDTYRLPGRELYRINPDKIKVAVALKDDKVYARCLIGWEWELYDEFYGHKTLSICNRIYYGTKRAEFVLGNYLRNLNIPIWFQYWSDTHGFLNNTKTSTHPHGFAILNYHEKYSVVSGDRFTFNKEGNKIKGTC